MRVLAKSGNTAATFNLGVILQERTTPEGSTEAEKCYRDAAWKSFTPAVVNLGLLLLRKGTAGGAWPRLMIGCELLLAP